MTADLPATVTLASASRATGIDSVTVLMSVTVTRRGTAMQQASDSDLCDASLRTAMMTVTMTAPPEKLRTHADSCCNESAPGPCVQESKTVVEF